MSPGPAPACYFVVMSGSRRPPIADLFCRNCLPNVTKSTNAARSAQFSGFFCRPAQGGSDDEARDRKRMGLECGLAGGPSPTGAKARQNRLTQGQQGCRKKFKKTRNRCWHLGGPPTIYASPTTAATLLATKKFAS